MATIKQFEDLEVWKLARRFCQEVHVISNAAVFAKDFELKNQLNASSGSIMDNIAEGFERNGSREFLQFLHYAKGSAGESRSQLYRALDKGYIDNDQFNNLADNVRVISSKLAGLIKYLQSSELKGSKFSEPDMEYTSDSVTQNNSSSSDAI